MMRITIERKGDVFVVFVLRIYATYGGQEEHLLTRTLTIEQARDLYEQLGEYF
jgi:hypothetical protein